MNVHEFEGKSEEEAIAKAIEALGLDRDEIDVEIVESKKSTFLFGGGKVRIRVHMDEERPAQAGLGDFPEAGLPYPDDLQPPADYGAPRRPRHRPRRQRRGSQRSGSRRSSSRGAGRYEPARDPVGGRLDTGPGTFLEPENDFEREMLAFVAGLIERTGISAQVRIAFREERKLILDVDSPDSGILIGKRGQTLEAIQTLVSVVASRKKSGEMRVIVDSQNYRQRRERSLVRMAEQAAEDVRRTGQSRLLEAMNPFERRLIHTTLSEQGDIETASEGDGLYKRVRIFYRGGAGGF